MRKVCRSIGGSGGAKREDTGCKKQRGACDEYGREIGGDAEEKICQIMGESRCVPITATKKI